MLTSNVSLLCQWGGGGHEGVELLQAASTPVCGTTELALAGNGRRLDPWLYWFGWAAGWRTSSGYDALDRRHHGCKSFDCHSMVKN